MVSTCIFISLNNHEQDDVIPASPGVITYRSQKTKVPKQTKLYPPLDLNTNFIRGETKIALSLGFGLNFPGWETTIITCRLNSDIAVLLVSYIHPKSLGTTSEIIHFPKAVQVFLNPTSIA